MSLFSKLARFADRGVSPGKPSSANRVQRSKTSGHVGRGNVAIYGLRESLDHTYRRLLNVLQELHDFAGVQDIDAIGVDRVDTGQDPTKRTKYTSEAMDAGTPLGCSYI